MQNQYSPTKTYLWCDACRRSYRHEDTHNGACPLCEGGTRALGKFSAILRGLMSNELAPSPLLSRHRQLVRLIWTQNGMGEQYYRVIAPEMSYNRFEARVTEILCQGAEEGWVEFIIPPAPQEDQSAYKLNLIDEDRFVAELQALGSPDASVGEDNR